MQSSHNPPYFNHSKVMSLSALRQQGIILIVCLVLLFVVTGLGLATIRNTGLEFKMVGSMNDRAIAFEAAEQTLKTAETWLATTALTEEFSYVNTCVGTGSATCFNPTCNNGLCVFYDLITPDPYTLTDAAPLCAAKRQPPATPQWKWDGAGGQPNLWTDNNMHRTLDGGVIDLHPDIVDEPKYIIEFMCYVDKGVQDCSSATLADQATKCAPLFQITALATGINSNTKVMLQSTYEKSN